MILKTHQTQPEQFARPRTRRTHSNAESNSTLIFFSTEFSKKQNSTGRTAIKKKHQVKNSKRKIPLFRLSDYPNWALFKHLWKKMTGVRKIAFRVNLSLAEINSKLSFAKFFNSFSFHRRFCLKIRKSPPLQMAQLKGIKISTEKTLLKKYSEKENVRLWRVFF